MISAARARRLCPVVEVRDFDELRRALDAGAEVVGVNARDLDTLVVDPVAAANVLAEVPPNVVALSFSGISTPAQVRALATEPRRRIDGVLVGEALMRQDDPHDLLSSLVAAARPL
jgi:indole-3-glycerol phosphate synthase